MGLAGPAPAWLAVHGSLQHPAGAGLAGRPEQAGAAAGPRTLWAEEAAARGVRGRPGTLGGRGLGLGPCLRGQRGAGSLRLQPGSVGGPWSPAGVRQPRPGPGYLGGRRGRRGPGALGDQWKGPRKVAWPACVQREARVRGAFRVCGGSSSSGCSSTAPFRGRGRARFRSLSARLGLGPRAAPSRHSGCRSGRKFSSPPPLLGRPWEQFRLLSVLLPGGLVRPRGVCMLLV